MSFCCTEISMEVFFLLIKGRSNLLLSEFVNYTKTIKHFVLSKSILQTKSLKQAVILQPENILTSFYCVPKHA